MPFPLAIIIIAGPTSYTVLHNTRDVVVLHTIARLSVTGGARHTRRTFVPSSADCSDVALYVTDRVPQHERDTTPYASRAACSCSGMFEVNNNISPASLPR